MAGLLTYPLHCAPSQTQSPMALSASSLVGITAAGTVGESHPFPSRALRPPFPSAKLHNPCDIHKSRPRSPSLLPFTKPASPPLLSYSSLHVSLPLPSSRPPPQGRKANLIVCLRKGTGFNGHSASSLLSHRADLILFVPLRANSPSFSFVPGASRSLAPFVLSPPSPFLSLPSLYNPSFTL